MVSSVFTPKTQPQSIAPKTTTTPTVKGTTTFEKFTNTNQPPKQSIDWSSVKTGSSSGTPTKKKSGSGGGSSTPTPTTFETFVAAPVIPTQSIQPPVVPPKTRESVVSFEKAKERTSGAFNTVFNVDKDNKQSVDIIKKPVSDMKRDSTFFESFIDNKQSVMPETRPRTVYQVSTPGAKTIYQMSEEQKQPPQSIDRTIQLKNLNRKIAELNQQITIMGRTSPMTRDEKLEKELKDKQSKLIAELETTRGVTKKGGAYYIETPTGVMTVDRIGDVVINKMPTSFSIPETYPTSITDVDTAFVPIDKEYKKLTEADEDIKKNIKDFETKKKDYENIVNYQTVKLSEVISDLKNIEQKNKDIKDKYDSYVASGNYKEANKIAKEYNKNLEKTGKEYSEKYSEYESRIKRLDELEKTDAKKLKESYESITKKTEDYNKQIEKYGTATTGYDALVKQYESVVNKPEASLKLGPEELQREMLKSKIDVVPKSKNIMFGDYSKLPEKFKPANVPVFEMTKRKIDIPEVKKTIGGMDLSISAVKDVNKNIFGTGTNYLEPINVVDKVSSTFKKELAKPQKEKQFELPKNVLYNIGEKAIATPYYAGEMLKSFAEEEDIKLRNQFSGKPSFLNTLGKVKSGVVGGAALYGSQFTDILSVPYRAINKDKASIYDYSQTKFKTGVGDISNIANLVTGLQGAGELATAFNAARDLKYASQSKYISGLGKVFDDLKLKYTQKELEGLYKASKKGKLSTVNEFKDALKEVSKKDIGFEGFAAGRKSIVKESPRLMQVAGGSVEDVKPLLKENIIEDVLKGFIQKSSFSDVNKINKATSPVLLYSRPGEKGVVVGEKLYSTLNLGKGKSAVLQRTGNELTTSLFSNERLISRSTEDVTPSILKWTSTKKTKDFSAQGITDGFLENMLLRESTKKGKLTTGKTVRPVSMQQTKEVVSKTGAFNVDIVEGVGTSKRLKITDDIDNVKPYIEDLLNLQGARDNILVTQKAKGLVKTKTQNYFGFKGTIGPEIPQPSKLSQAKEFIKSKADDFITNLEKINERNRFKKSIFSGKRAQVPLGGRQVTPKLYFSDDVVGEISKSKIGTLKTPTGSLSTRQIGLLPTGGYNFGKAPSKIISVIKLLPTVSNIGKVNYKTFVTPKTSSISKIGVISKIGTVPKLGTVSSVKPISLVGTLPSSLQQTSYKTAAITKITAPVINKPVYVTSSIPTPSVPAINTPWTAFAIPKGFPGSGSNTLGKGYRGKRKSVTDKYLENYFARLTRPSTKQKIQNYKI